MFGSIVNSFGRARTSSLVLVGVVAGFVISYFLINFTFRYIRLNVYMRLQLQTTSVFVLILLFGFLYR